MKKIFTFIVLSFIIFSEYSAQAKDDLWNKAVNISEKNKNYKASNIILFVDDLKKDLTVNSSQQIYQKLRKGKEIKYDTVKVIKDGKDITEETLKKRNSDKNRKSFLEDNDIFDKKVQDKITYSKSGSENINSIICTVYSYNFNKNDKEKYAGKAWINKENGNPVKVEYTMSPLPMGLKEILIKYNYETKKDKTYLKTIFAQGEASFLLLKKIFRMKLELKDHKNI